jgi:hypothetical protein
MKSFLEFLLESKYQDEVDRLLDGGRKIYLADFMKTDTSYGNKLPAGIRNKYPFDTQLKIDLDKLIATDSSVEVNPILDILNNFNMNKVNIKVIVDNGKYYIVDGHHTITALYIMNKIKNIPIKAQKI